MGALLQGDVPLMQVFSVIATATLRISPLPVPVHVVDKLIEGPWAKAGAIFAIVAALAAIGAVFVAILTLNIAKEELRVVREDLANNRRLIDEALRHPDLRPMPDPSVDIAGSPNAPSIINLQFHISPRNVGERLARNLAAEWLIPLNLIADQGDRPLRTVFGEQYVIFRAVFPASLVLWPDGVPGGLVHVNCAVRGVEPEATVLLRFYDDAGTYPRAAWYRYHYTRNPESGHVRLEPLFSFVQWGE